jgi:hypothetical protein
LRKLELLFEYARLLGRFKLRRYLCTAISINVIFLFFFDLFPNYGGSVAGSQLGIILGFPSTNEQLEVFSSSPSFVTGIPKCGRSPSRIFCRKLRRILHTEVYSSLDYRVVVCKKKKTT